MQPTMIRIPAGGTTPPVCFCDEPIGSVGSIDIDPEAIARVARGLAHPSRVAMIELFDDGVPRMTGDIVAASGSAQSTVSEHLRILREAGILVSMQDGPRVWYCLRRSALCSFGRAITVLAARPDAESPQ